ncbi:MAG: hypothetical protein IPH77_21005 [Ignavibacteria bacterium]|nr:hypothetical protein [Ignavibacteria bacterium]
MAGRLSDHKLIKFVKDNFFDLLLPEFKENMIFFTDAFYSYSKGNWEKSLESAMKIKNKLKFDEYEFIKFEKKVSRKIGRDIIF